MLKLRPGIEIYLSIGAVDMRKSIDTLSALIIDEFSGDPRSGHLFVCLRLCQKITFPFASH